MTGPLPLSPMARALRPRPRNMAPAPQMAGDQGPGMIPNIGGETVNADPRGAGRDQRSFGSFSEMMNDPDFQGDWGKVAAMSGPMALGVGAASAMTGWGGLGDKIQNGFGGGRAGFSGMSEPSNVPGAPPSSMQGSFNEFNGIAAERAALEAQIAAAEAAGQAGDPTMGGGVGVNAADLGDEPNAPGMFADGGMVRRSDLGGPNPPGPDEGYAALSPGEVVVNQSQQQRMGPQARSAMMRALHGGRR